MLEEINLPERRTEKKIMWPGSFLQQNEEKLMICMANKEIIFVSFETKFNGRSPGTTQNI
jgi:hypothetical protein